MPYATISVVQNIMDGMLTSLRSVPERHPPPPAGVCRLPWVYTQNHCDSPVPIALLRSPTYHGDSIDHTES